MGRRGTTADIGDNLLPSMTVFGCSLTAVEVETGPLSDVVLPSFLLPSSFSFPWYCALYDLFAEATRSNRHVRTIVTSFFSQFLIYLRKDRWLLVFSCTLFHLWCAKGGGSISFPRLWSSSVILLLVSRSRKHKGGWIWWRCALVWLWIWVWCSDRSISTVPVIYFWLKPPQYSVVCEPQSNALF